MTSDIADSSSGLVVAGILFCLVMPLNAVDLAINIDTASGIRTIPETMYGANLMAWDGRQNGTNTNFNNLMIASGRKYMRWPGGSWGDAFLWSDMEGPNGQNTWIVSYSETLNLLSQIGGTMQPIVNFPGYWYDQDHSHAEAIAAAVAWVQDQSGRTPTAQYWEIGNEIMGPWEAGWFEGMHGSYYGGHFADFYTAMKAENPNIKIGAVADPYDKPDWWNPGLWTRETLLAAEANGVVPDFLIIHAYPGSGRRGDYNATLLAEKIDEIEVYTDSLDFIIADTIGAEHVGQIPYWMTEFRTGGISTSDDPNDPYERWKLYVSALFNAQYVMEMAKHGWQGSNVWSQWEFYDNWRVFPDWYVYPFLTNRFGRDLVDTASSYPMVRAYASTDDANNLTLFITNNSPDANLTARINIIGLAPATAAQSWLIEPAGTILPGGTIQEANDIQINGIFHPDPLTLDTLSSQTITPGDAFDINLPRSCMLFLTIPVSPGGQVPFGGAAHAIPGIIEAEDYDLGGPNIAHYDTTTGNSAGACRSDDVDIETCSEGGYNVTAMETSEWLEYFVNVASTGLYQAKARVASATTGGCFHIEFDGADVTGPVTFGPTGGDQTWTTVSSADVVLTSGKHVMRIAIDANGWNLDRLRFTRTGGGTGKITRQWWAGVSGTSVTDLLLDPDYPDNPTGYEYLARLEAPENWADTYGTRIRGYLHPLATGSYTFWLAGDDNCDLRLSTDDDPANAMLIANVPGWTGSHEWNKYTQQQSSPIFLTAGQKYYIEVLHKEGYGGDNVAVAWQGPGLPQQVIDGIYLSPCCLTFTDFADFAANWRCADCAAWNRWCRHADSDGDGAVLLDDFRDFADAWLLGF